MNPQENAEPMTHIRTICAAYGQLGATSLFTNTSLRSLDVSDEKTSGECRKNFRHGSVQICRRFPTANENARTSTPPSPPPSLPCLTPFRDPLVQIRHGVKLSSVREERSESPALNKMATVCISGLSTFPYTTYLARPYHPHRPWRSSRSFYPSP